MMISLMFPQSPFQVTTIIFYACIWLPLLQIKQALVQLLGLTPPTAECGHAACRGEPNDDDQLYDLPVAAFHEVEGTDAKVGELCSICLSEFQAEEEVSQLPVCGHIFHVRCIRNWVDRDQFTCPLCRCLIFRIHDYCGKCGLLCTN